MKQRRLIWLYGLSLGWLLGQLPVWADITPDQTLPSASQVRRNRRTTVITGGTQRGSNLFHSFREFSVPGRGTASFQAISPDVTNIFSRVTGSSASRINGVLEALQDNGSLSRANFWLINPNGIQFGRNAALNLGGAFIAATADAIRFANGAEFSAVDPQASPLLTVSVPVGLQFGPNAGQLSNQSRSNLVSDQSGELTIGGLRVGSGQPLVLLGSPLVLPGGYVSAPGGQIELGSVTEGRVGLDTTAPIWQIDYRGAEGDALVLSQLASVSATDPARQLPGGSIQLWGDQIRLQDEAFILSDTLAGTQNGRDITLRANRLSLSDFSIIGTTTTADAHSGNIRIQTNQLSTTASAIITFTTGAGDAGDLRVQADTILLSGQGSALPQGAFANGLLAQTAEGSTGRGGNIQITANRLTVTNGAQIGSDTSGRGRAGNIEIQAGVVDLSGVLQRNGEPALKQGLPYPAAFLPTAMTPQRQRGATFALTPSGCK